MPSSPRTPYRQRPSSSIDTGFVPSSPHANGYSPNRPSHSRKSSLHSVNTPITPRPRSSHDRNFEFGFVGETNGVIETGNGLGSLADELAEAWDEDEEGEEETPWVQQGGDEGNCNGGRERERQETQQYDYQHDMGIGIALSPGLQQRPNGSSSPPKQSLRPKRQRIDSQYDGSDYGDDSGLQDSPSIPHSLEAHMAAIESLSRQGVENDGSEADGVVKRVVESLRDLGSQAGVESGTTRLSTAHTALTTHLTYQTRLLQTLTHPLVSPLSTPPSPEVIDPLLPLLSSLLLSLPNPLPQPIASLHALHASTTDLLSTLSYLSDTLHMSRQTTTLAARRLKAAKEIVERMKCETEEREEGIRWVEKGGWEKRLSGRECARVCGEVVGGFEEVCRGWRERLAGDGGGMEVVAG